MRSIVVVIAAAAVSFTLAACPSPSPKKKPPAPPVFHSLPTYVQHQKACETTSTDKNGVVVFHEVTTFNAAEQVTSDDVNRWGAGGVRSIQYNFFDAAGHFRDDENVKLSQTGFNDATYGNEHVHYDAQGRVASKDECGHDGREHIGDERFTYDDQDRVVVDALVFSLSSGLQSRTDTFTYDDEDRVTHIDRDLGGDGTVDQRFDFAYDGNTTTETVDQPPSVTHDTSTDDGYRLHFDRDDGADGKIDRTVDAVLDRAGHITGYTFDNDGDGVPEFTEAYTVDDAIKALTATWTDTNGAFVETDVFDYSCFPFAPPARGSCDDGFDDTPMGCARITVAPALDFGRQRHGAFLTGGTTILAIGGAGGNENGVILDDVEAVDVDADGSDPIAKPSFVAAGASAFARVPDGRVVEVGGIRNGVFAPTATFYDPETGATTTGPALAPRVRPLVAVLTDGSVLVVGGEDASGLVGAVERFGPDALSASTLADVPTPRRDAALVALPGPDPIAIVVGGNDGAAPLDETELLAADGTWSAGPPLSLPRSGAAVATMPDGTIVVAGGLGANPTSSVDVIDVAAGTAVARSPLPTPLVEAAAVVLPDGRLFVAGGFGATERDGASARTFAWDPKLDVWAEGPPLFVPRYRAVPVALADGRVAFVGGAIDDMQTTAAIEVLAVAP